MAKIINNAALRRLILGTAERHKPFWECKCIDPQVKAYFEYEIEKLIRAFDFSKLPKSNGEESILVKKSMKELLLKSHNNKLPHFYCEEVDEAMVDIINAWIVKRIIERVKNYPTGCGKTFRV